MKTYFSYLILFFPFICSCGKGIFGDARADGIVKDKTTDKTVPNATIYLLENDNSGSIIGTGSSSIIIDSTLSDSDGEFEFKYDNKNRSTYYVSAKKDGYIFDMYQTPILSLGIGIDVEIYIDPQAYLQIHYKNIPPASPSDDFSVNGYVTDDFYGSDIDTLVVYIVKGNFSSTLYWGLYGSEVYSEAIYCPAFDTTIFEILY